MYLITGSPNNKLQSMLKKGKITLIMDTFTAMCIKFNSIHSICNIITTNYLPTKMSDYMKEMTELLTITCFIEHIAF